MINVATPCLVLSTLLRLRFELGALATMASASAACMALAAFAAVPLLLVLRLPLRVYLPALTFPNAGNMGMPLCLFAFGETGLGLAVVFFAVLAVTQFTLGPAIAAGRADPMQFLRTPVIHAVALALLLQVVGVGLPRWAANTTTLLGNCAVPLMLVSLGVALASLRVTGLGRALAMSLVRLESSMPVAVFNYLWAVRYGTAPEEVAGMVLGSTALSFVGLPFLLLVVM